MKKLSLEQVQSINGGGCSAGDILGIGLGIAGVVALFVAPPSAFFIVPASTAAGISLGQSASCLI